MARMGDMGGTTSGGEVPIRGITMIETIIAGEMAIAGGATTIAGGATIIVAETTITAGGMKVAGRMRIADGMKIVGGGRMIAVSRIVVGGNRAIRVRRVQDRGMRGSGVVLSRHGRINPSSAQRRRCRATRSSGRDRRSPLRQRSRRPSRFGLAHANKGVINRMSFRYSKLCRWDRQSE